jgi:hypothetical protein
LLDLPEWATGGFCGEPGMICANCASDLAANLLAAGRVLFGQSGRSISAGDSPGVMEDGDFYGDDRE